MLAGQLQQTSFARNDGLVGEVHSQNRADRVQDVAAQGTTGVAGTLLVLAVHRPRARHVHLGGILTSVLENLITRRRDLQDSSLAFTVLVLRPS